MPITTSDIKWYRSVVANDLVSNGGRMSNVQAISAAAGNIFPNATEAQRVTGIPSQFRKMFIKNDNADDLILYGALLHQDNVSPGDDSSCFWMGTQEDTQNDITGAEEKYGSGYLNEGVLIGATSLDVYVEDPTQIIFRDGDTVRISDKADPEGSGNEELLTIAGVPSIVGNIVTMELAVGVSYNFSMGVTKVASVLSLGDLKPSAGAVAVTAAGDGDYDDTASPLVLNNKGAVAQNWVLTFTSATAFNVEGDSLGIVGSGNVSGGASPNNPLSSTPYFELSSAGFSGTFEAGDTIEFSTTPAAAAIWFRRYVPPGAAAISSNIVTYVVDGESV